MKCLKNNYLYFRLLSAFLIFAITFGLSGFGSLCSTTSGTETTYYNYTSIYPNNQLNQNVIDRFNNMTTEEKAQLLPILSPLFLKSLGIYTNDAYSQINQLYNTSLASFQDRYSTAQDLQDSDESYAIKKCYTYLSRGHGYRYYENFDDFLGMNIVEEDGVLVLTDTQTVYNLYDDVIQDELQENGVIKLDLMSYNSLNSSVFDNVSLYSNFIGLCRTNASKKYVLICKDSYWIYIAFPNVNPNLYNNGSTLGQTLQLCTDQGGTITSWTTYRAYRPNTTSWSTTNTGFRYANMVLGGPTPANKDGGQSSNNVASGWSIYTLNDNDTEVTTFTSLNGWVNHQGNYTPSYQLGSNYGNVPSAVVSSNDMTTYYNNTYIDNSVHDSNNVYYPPNYMPDSNSYDTDTHTLKFDGIASFLSSLGSLIGSLINGLAQGIANIVNSLISVCNNLIQNFTGGVIFELLQAFLGWLPPEIVGVLTGLFTITVIFALIKLIKGFF